MAQNKGLIILVTTVAVMTLAVGLGLFLFLPRSAELTQQDQKPQVIRVNVLQEETPSTPATEQTDNQDRQSTPPATVQSPIEVPGDTGLLRAPPAPIPTAPNQLTQETPNRRAEPASPASSEEPNWTRPTTARNTPSRGTEPSTRTDRSRQASTPTSLQPATRSAVSPSNTFWVQVGAFQSQTQAETASSRLSSRGWHATITTFRSGSGTLYRVRLGPWQNKQDAESFLNRLKNTGGWAGAYVVRGG